ncbi:ABC transporter permease [Falsibacillus albus]|uniref:ABC transporter permease n=1 Tax=Falsibacillus albus TaxID=2478915 RepID=A0A3L7JWY1_9BACI|nr:ABC transporter permease [Falsibacillus albus]RLQ94835.1 ABC transporter permease [Falsibacillus albus]
MIYTTFLSEFRKEWIEMKRYPLEWISSMIVLIIIFFGIFLGASYISGQHIHGKNLSYTIVSFAQYILLMGPIYLMGLGIVREAEHGTLEQLFLTPVGPETILMIRAVVAFVYQIISMFIILEVIMLLTGQHLELNIFIVPPLITTYLTSIGIGYLITSVAIIYKRISQFLDLFQFVLLFLVMIPFSDFKEPFQWLSMIVPYAASSGWLRDAMVQGEVSNHVFIISGSFINSLVWFAAGIIVLRFSVRSAKKRASLSHY